jgi:hypothetical protein
VGKNSHAFDCATAVVIAVSGAWCLSQVHAGGLTDWQWAALGSLQMVCAMFYAFITGARYGWNDGNA